MRQGFFYFVDRVGDTFRWKGENVSTTEVAAVVAPPRGSTDAAVYGVSVPHADGRAGMAALVTGPGFSLAGFRRAVGEQLPAYARPVFVRIVARLRSTGTFKLRKQELALAGLRSLEGLLTRSTWMNLRGGSTSPSTPAKYQQLLAGGLRL